MKFIVLREVTPIRVLAIFEEGELLDIMNLARMIQSNKHNFGVRSKKIADNYSNLDICYVGLKGEFAVSKYFGLKMNKNIFRGGDGGDDLVIPHNNKTIQVKYSTINAFYCREESQFVSDYGVLTQPANYAWVPQEYAEELDIYLNEKTSFCCKHVLISGILDRQIWDERKKRMKFRVWNVGVGLEYMRNPVIFHDILEEERKKAIEIDSYL